MRDQRFPSLPSNDSCYCQILLKEVLRWLMEFRYHELGQHAFGKTWGNWIVIPPQLIVMIGLGITYTYVSCFSLDNLEILMSCYSFTSGLIHIPSARLILGRRDYALGQHSNASCLSRSKPLVLLWASPYRHALRVFPNLENKPFIICAAWRVASL